MATTTGCRAEGGFQTPSPLAGEGWGEGGIYAACLCAPSPPALSREGRGSEDQRRCRPADWGEQGFDGGPTADRHHQPVPRPGGPPSPLAGEGWGEGVNLRGVPVRLLSPALSREGRGSGDRRRCRPGDWGEQGFDGGLTADRNHHPVPSRGGFAPSPLAGEGWGEGVNLCGVPVRPSPQPSPARGEGVEISAAVGLETGVNRVSMGVQRRITTTTRRQAEEVLPPLPSRERVGERG